MKWGRVSYNGARGHWCVRGEWQGKRLYFAAYRTAIGWKTCETQAEADLLSVVIGSEIANGAFNPLRYKRQRPLHLAQYAEAWLEMVRPTLAHATYKAYRAAVVHIKAGLGHEFLPDLNYEKIMNWVNGLELEIKTVKNYHGVLAKILRDAKKSGHIPQAPELVEFRAAMAVPYKAPEWIERDTQERILAEIPAEHRPIIRFLMATGVRPSEARALQKRDLYIDRGYIMVRRTFAPDAAGGEALKEVKQKRERMIPLYSSVADVLAEITPQLTPWVFIHQATGKPYSKNINRDIWNPACLKAIGHVIPLNNACRHSLANQMLARGESLDRVRLALGHSNASVTAAHYGDERSGLDALRKAIDNVRRVK